MPDIVDGRFAPPQAHVADVAPAEVALAGRGARLLAALIDLVIAACVIWALGRIPAAQAMFMESGARMSITSLNPFSVLLGAGGFLLVQGWPLLTRGQTIGKILCKLRIVRTDGSRPSAWRLLGLRYGIGFGLNLNVGSSLIYGLVDSLLIFRTSRKCLHDSIADTRVIKL